MTLFALKKFFLDTWDNLMSHLLLNLVTLLILSAGFLIPGALRLEGWASLAFTVPSVLIALVWHAVLAGYAADLADYGGVRRDRLWTHLGRNLGDYLVVSLAMLMVIFGFVFSVPYYLNAFEGWLGWLASGVVMAVLVILLLALPFYLPLRHRTEGSRAQCFGRAFRLVWDNPLFALFWFVFGLVILLASTFLIFLVPGVLGFSLWYETGLRLRLLGYDYAEAHPGTRWHKMPWRQILADEKRQLGSRNFKTMFMPWKD